MTAEKASSAALSREILLGNPLVRRQLAALAEAGQGLALKWLLEAPMLSSVAELEGDGECQVLLVAGQSQVSRRAPLREAKQWLERERANLSAPGEAVLLYGFGNPLAVELILTERPLIVYEPDPLLVLAIFKHYDFSQALLNDGCKKLTLLTPWHLAGGKIPKGMPVLVHPPAQRRAAAQLSNLKKALDIHQRDLGPLAGRSLRIMVIPPISGGSLSVAESLAEAVENSAHSLCFLGWDESLRQQEIAVHNASPSEAPKLVSRLFENTGRRAMTEAAFFRPDLLIALAQAPLDNQALLRLREATDAPFVFWLLEDFRYFSYAAEVVPAYDALFHIQKDGIDETLRNWGLGRCAYLPLAADPSLFKPVNKASLPKGYCADLSFMGAGYPNRRLILSRLAESYWPSTGRAQEAFKVFGSGWEGAGERLRAHFFEGGRRVSPSECAMIYAGGLVNLNIHSSFYSSPEFEPSSLFVNPRTFEIAAAGSFQIVDGRPLLPELFTSGRELMAIDDPAELPDVIEHFLNHPNEALAMGQAARGRVIAEHGYDKRLESILAFMGWSPVAATAGS